MSSSDKDKKSAADETKKMKTTGCNPRRKSRSDSSTGDEKSRSPASSSSETSPMKQTILKFLSPKMLSGLKPRRWSTEDKGSSPTEHYARPVCSSECSGGELSENVSPITDMRYFSEIVTLNVTLEGDNRIDYESLDEDKIIPAYLNSRSCYDAMPVSGKVIVLSTELLVKNAFSCLVTNEIRSAPLWESSSQTFVGMLTITDFINVLRHYYYSSQEDIKDIENQKIATWRRITKVTKPIISIPPHESLATATKLLIQERVHRLPVYDEKRNGVLFVLTRKRLLKHLYKNLLSNFDVTKLKAPSFWKKTISELRPKLGTWDNIAKVSYDTKVITALDIFCEKKVSALPVVENDKLVDIFAKFDVFALANKQTYDNLDMTIAEALDKAEVHDRACVSTLDESFGTVIDRFLTTMVHRVVIVNEKQEVIGMISLSDILRFLVVQPLEESAIATDTIEEDPEGAVGGQDDDSSVFSDATDKLQKSASLEKQDSSEISDDFVKLQLADTPEASMADDET